MALGHYSLFLIHNSCFMENLDSRLMAASEADRKRQEEMAYSDQLRQQRLGTEDKERQAEGETGEPRSLRQRAQAARQALNIKEQAKKKLEEKVTAPAKIGTSNALRWAWMTLIPSFGLSLIYINIHVFLRMVLGEKLFCKLGEEWIPKQVSAVGGEAGKSLSKSIGIIEVMGLVFLDLMALFLIIVVFSLLTLITSFLGAGLWEKIKWVWTAIGSLGWGAINALISLFKSF